MLNLNNYSTKIQATGQISPDLAKLLDSVVENAKFPALFRLHEMVSEHTRRFSSSPNRSSSLEMAQNDVSSFLDEISAFLEDFAEFNASNSKYLRHVTELIDIFRNPYLKALVATSCKVAGRNFEQSLPDIPSEVDEDEGVNIRIVRLIKNSEPLGATIKVDEKSGFLVIARVMHGGVADRSGCINVGDRVLEVNGYDVTGKQPVDVVKLLNTSNGTVVFKLMPALDPLTPSKIDAGNGDGKIYLRALFDYDPSSDKMNPCPEAGLSFLRHEVLQIVDWNDPHWWQATAVNSSFGISEAGNQSRVGLIPSKQLQELRLTQTISPTDKELMPIRNSRRQKKIMYETRAADDFEMDEIRTYEEVALLYPRPGLHRPVVFIGPQGVGRNELKRRLILLNPDRFATTVPHTSRRPKPNETDGLEYRFSARPTMEQWVTEGRFVEYGEYKGNLYGTTVESVKAILAQNRICLLNPHPQALRTLRNAELKPYVIFVKPPPFDVLKETRQAGRVRSTFDSSYNRGFTDDELEQMAIGGKNLERCYGYCFDYVLVNAHLESTFRELLDVIYRLETLPQWVPASWI